MDRRRYQTEIAGKATSLAEFFNERLRNTLLGSDEYRPQMAEPEGQSTGGGARARQSIRLVPREPNVAAILVGFANSHSKRAELRTFEHLQALHRERAHQELPFDSASYTRFTEAAKRYLDLEGLEVHFVSAPMSDNVSRDDLALPAQKSNAGLLFLIGLGGLLVAVLALAWVAFSHRK